MPITGRLRLAQGAANAVAAMLAEQVPHAEIDLIDVIFGHIKEAADGLCRFVADFFFRWTQFFRKKGSCS